MPQTQLVSSEQPLTGVSRENIAQSLIQAHLANPAWMAAQWESLHADWLNYLAARGSGSDHTRRNYVSATHQWAAYLATQRHLTGPDAGAPVQLWQAEASHVRDYTAAFVAAGLSAATINSRLAAISSFYSFVIGERRLIGGIEMCLFADATGAPRSNPFRAGNLQRPTRPAESERARPLQPDELGKLFTWLDGRRKTLTGARNYALILTYLETGFRSVEVMRMQWGHLRPSRSQRDRVVYAWVGKGDKHEDEPLPAIVWQAITHYLTLDGRWRAGVAFHEQPMSADDYIFRPVHTAGIANLRGVVAFNPAAALSGKSAIRILRTALRHAGVPDAARVRIHDLRHTWALRMVAAGAGEHEIKSRAHHSSLDTTGRYLASLKRKLRDRKDIRSGALERQLHSYAGGAAPESWEEVIEGRE